VPTLNTSICYPYNPGHHPMNKNLKKKKKKKNNPKKKKEIKAQKADHEKVEKTEGDKKKK